MGNPNQPGGSTIAIDLWGRQERGAAPNTRTIAGTVSIGWARPASLRQLFVRAYDAFAQPCRAVDEPGLAIIAVDERGGRAQGLVTLRARVDRHVASIVGRHDHVDLFLNSSTRLALRQLAVVVDPVTSWRRGDGSVRYRVLDLRTDSGFQDEHGNGLRGLRCEGPALLRCGGHALFLLPLGDPSDWPPDADDAWECLPERVYFDELRHQPEGSVGQEPPSLTRLRRSMLLRTQGVHDSGTRLPRVDPTNVAGVLELEGPHRSGEIALGHDELHDGVLLGRYARCDSTQLIDDPSMSRVHAMLLQAENRLLVIDTASMNGTRIVGQSRARVIELRGETELQLGKQTRARWRYVS
jgi:hypothetical protein